MPTEAVADYLKKVAHHFQHWLSALDRKGCNVQVSSHRRSASEAQAQTAAAAATTATGATTRANESRRVFVRATNGTPRFR
jgi:hypothetical protein